MRQQYNIAPKDDEKVRSEIDAINEMLNSGGDQITYNVGSRPGLTVPVLNRIRQTLATRANSRLTRLRKYMDKEDITYNPALEYFESQMPNDSKKYFTEKPNKSNQDIVTIRHNITSIINFLKMGSSTIKGAQDYFTVTQDNIYRYTKGRMIIDRPLYNLLHDFTYRALVAAFDSETVFDYMERAREAGFSEEESLHKAFESMVERDENGNMREYTRKVNGKESVYYKIDPEKASVATMFNSLGIKSESETQTILHEYSAKAEREYNKAGWRNA